MTKASNGSMSKLNDNADVASANKAKRVTMLAEKFESFSNGSLEKLNESRSPSTKATASTITSPLGVSRANAPVITKPKPQYVAVSTQSPAGTNTRPGNFSS